MNSNPDRKRQGRPTTSGKDRSSSTGRRKPPRAQSTERNQRSGVVRAPRPATGGRSARPELKSGEGSRKAKSARPTKPGAGKRTATPLPRRATQPRPRVTPAPARSQREGGERLQKILAQAGIASRRASEDLIAQGRVRVNGSTVRIQGVRVDPSVDRIEVDGERINVSSAYRYMLVNKPVGVVTTASDPQGRPTVLDLVRSPQRIYPVGRLDVDTFGLLILTNHGELAHRLAHPRYEIPRTYLAEVRGNPSPSALASLRSGIMLEDGPARARSVRVRGRASSRSQIEIVLTEGRKREVRRMFESIGHPVVQLVRVGYGPIDLGDLAIGKSRPLSPGEIGKLLEAVGL